MKVGGCEALRDMYEARVIGVERVVAPMVESSYALHKFLAAAKLAFPDSERSDVRFCVNVETAAGFDCLDAMLGLPEIDELDGVVLGRVDMCGSLGLTRDDVNHPGLRNRTSVVQQSEDSRLGMRYRWRVGAEALSFMRNLENGLLDRYETRKSCLAAQEPRPNADKGILKAVGFELMWLKNKRDFYGCIFEEDRVRIDMLESRYDELIVRAGGLYE